MTLRQVGPAELLWVVWPLTQHPQPADFVHEQRRHNVARQHGQRAQETDKVDHVGIVLVADVAEQAALLVVQEGAVDQAAIDQPVLEEIWDGRRRGTGCRKSEEGLLCIIHQITQSSFFKPEKTEERYY